jgi:hypothetical protein
MYLYSLQIKGDSKKNVDNSVSTTELTVSGVETFQQQE